MLNFFKSKSRGSKGSKGGSSGKLKELPVDPKPTTTPTPPEPGAALPDLEMPKDLPKVSLEDFDLLKVLG